MPAHKDFEEDLFVFKLLLTIANNHQPKTNYPARLAKKLKKHPVFIVQKLKKMESILTKTKLAENNKSIYSVSYRQISKLYLKYLESSSFPFMTQLKNNELERIIKAERLHSTISLYLLLAKNIPTKKKQNFSLIHFFEKLTTAMILVELRRGQFK